LAASPDGLEDSLLLQPHRVDAIPAVIMAVTIIFFIGRHDNCPRPAGKRFAVAKMPAAKFN
jgi:hypothetical protein